MNVGNSSEKNAAIGNNPNSGTRRNEMMVIDDGRGKVGQRFSGESNISHWRRLIGVHKKYGQT